MEEVPNNDLFMPEYSAFERNKNMFELFKNSGTTKKLVTDLQLCDVYHKAVVQLLDLPADVENVAMLRSYLTDFDNLADDWCQFTRTNIQEYDRLIDSMMDSLYYRIIYIYRNGLLLSSAVSLHFSTVLSENPEVSRKLLQKKRILRICSVGGGSASDVVAIVSVLEALAEDLDIRVTILDKDARWKNTSFVVLRCLKTFRNATWRINFVTCDLSGEELTHEAALAVKNADVVTLVKFISEFEGNRKALQSTITNTINAISPGSMLFVLDVADDSDHIEACGNLSGEIDHCQLLYEDICYLHTIDMDAIEKIILLYQKHFSALQINSCYEMCVRIWLKTRDNSKYKTSDRQLQMRFRRELDQYNLHETLMSRGFFQKWRQQYSIDMKRKGWSRDTITMLQFHTKMFVDKLIEFILKSKYTMDRLTDKLERRGSISSEQNACALKIVGQFSEEDWYEYLDCKYDFVSAKDEAYKHGILSLYNHMTRTVKFN